MRCAVILTVAVFATASADDKKAGDLPVAAKKELGRLQGEWGATEMSARGERIDLADLKLVLEIKGDKWIFTGKEKARFSALDPTTDPKCFDLTSVEEGRKGRVDEGIYKIDGDTLTLCFHQGVGKTRPTRFEATADEPDTILGVFKRVKPK